VGLGGLGRGIRDVLGAGGDGVLAGDVDDVAAQPLAAHGQGGLPGDQERPPRHHVVL
jgi:hypothetical protein